jgi:large subunit ribosomal protein L25
MSTRTLAAAVRTETGKNVNNRLRTKGMIPAVINWHGNTEMVSIAEKDFLAVFKGHISESVIVDLDVAGKEKVQVFVKDFQTHPVSDRIQHIDFYRVTAGEKIHTIVPVEATGFAVGQKKGGIVAIVEHQLSVHVLPSELPEKIVVDVTNLDVNDAVRVKDLKVAPSVTFAFDPEHIVIHVVLPKAEAEGAEGEAATEA